MFRLFYEAIFRKYFKLKIIPLKKLAIDFVAMVIRTLQFKSSAF
ncbi:hypothetical protein JM81_0520 [Maribacter sp. MAR_2009_72]|nr:hypothetical protein JM81_0520 [Maribacter sp. MAR_2009_72]